MTYTEKKEGEEEEEEEEEEEKNERCGYYSEISMFSVFGLCIL